MGAKYSNYKIMNSKLLIIYAFLLNLFSGVLFAQLLQIPYSTIFSQSDIDLNPLASVALFLTLYRLGRLIVSLLDYKLPRCLQENGLYLGINIIGLSMIVIYISPSISLSLIQLAAFLGGIGTTLSNIHLRELLTLDTDLNKKRLFNIYSNIGWSIGVGISGFLLLSTYFNFEIYLGLILVLTSVLLLLLESKVKFIKKTNESSSVNLIDLFKTKNPQINDLLLVLIMFSLLNGLVTNQINSSIMYQLSKVFRVPEAYQSLVLLLPIVGSLALLIPRVSKLFNKSPSLLEIGLLNLIYYSFLLVLSYSSHFLIYCGALVLVGLISNEILSATYQVIASKQETGLRRPTHALIEGITVGGSFLTWTINKLYSEELTLNLLLIVLLPSLLLLFVKNFKIFMNKGNQT
jgi:hypothetical protein